MGWDTGFEVLLEYIVLSRSLNGLNSFSPLSKRVEGLQNPKAVANVGSNHKQRFLVFRVKFVKTEHTGWNRSLKISERI